MLSYRSQNGLCKFISKKSSIDELADELESNDGFRCFYCARHGDEAAVFGVMHTKVPNTPKSVGFVVNSD